MTQVNRKIPAVLLEVIIGTALCVAVGIMATQTAYAADVQLKAISFEGTVPDEEAWPAHMYPLENKDATLTLDQLAIGVVDKKGNTVPADAYTLEIISTWYDETAGQDRSVPLKEPYGMAKENPFTTSEGYNEIIVKVSAVKGKGYTGEVERYVMFYDVHSLYYICSDLSFPDSWKENEWRMGKAFFATADAMANPVLKDGAGKTLEFGKDYTLKYYNRLHDETNDVMQIRGDLSQPLDATPTEPGKYLVQVVGLNPYYGGNVYPFDITATKNLTYVKALTKKSKPITVKYAAVKKAKQTIAVDKYIEFQNGIVMPPGVQDLGPFKIKPYTKAGKSKNLSVKAGTGSVTVKKGTKKGTYSIKVRLQPASIYELVAGGKTVTCYVKVK